jgi:hypothetical protein
MCADELNKIFLSGRIEKKNLGGTSKSAHVGFVLQTTQGPVKLRREGGNPFYDDFFEKYEDQETSVEGYDMDQYFLVTAINIQ